MVMENIVADFTRSLKIPSDVSSVNQTFNSKSGTITYTGFKVCFKVLCNLCYV